MYLLRNILCKTINILHSRYYLFFPFNYPLLWYPFIKPGYKRNIQGPKLITKDYKSNLLMIAHKLDKVLITMYIDQQTLFSPRIQ
jgi:hypothetical protein